MKSRRVGATCCSARAKEEKKEALLTKYGGKEHLEVPDGILRAEWLVHFSSTVVF